jgi:hypothetical protein
MPIFSLCADTGAATWRKEEKGRGESKGTAEVGSSTGVGDGRRRQAELKNEVWDWPLDGIRVHAFGPKQNFYASPDTQ